MYLLFERMSIKAIRHIIPIMPFLLLAAVILVFAMSSRVKNKSLGSIILFSLLLGVSLSNGYRIFRYLDALKQTDPRTAARSWAQNNIPPNSISCVEGFPPFLDRQIDPLDQRQFRIRTIELTAKSLTIIPDFFDFLKQEERLYYIADGFTRQIFLWKHSQRRYKEIVANRMAFWAWLEEHGEVIQRFPSSHPPLQPEIIIYELRSSL
jgi:hypothetical protein